MTRLEYLFIALFATLFLCGCANPDNNNLDNGINGNTAIIYATNISINEEKLTYFVGDSLKLQNLNVSISPTNATVKPNYVVNNTQVAQIANNTLSFISEGSVILTASVLIDVNTYKTYSITFNVETKPIYATSVSVCLSDVTLNFDETSVNNAIICPAVYNQGVLVTYSNENVVEYNYQTGLITPKSIGETTVSIKVLKSKTESLETSFNVVVTNNIYAQSLSDIKINNKVVSETITLFTNETGTISCSVLPQDYNLGITYLSSNNLININSDGNFMVGTETGDCTVTVSVTTKTGLISKSINIQISTYPKTLSFKVTQNNDDVEYLYANTPYLVTILTELSNYSNITFENCNYSYVSNNTFEINVPIAGNINLVANHTLSSFVSSYNVKGTQNFNVYNKIEDINFNLTNNGTEIVPNLGVYTIYLPNKNFLSNAISDNLLVYADINLSAKGINTKPNSISVSVLGEAVVLTGNRIVANSLGESELLIVSNDIGEFNKTVTIKVEPLEVAEIFVENTEVNLFINGNETQPNNFTILYLLNPTYAYNTNVEIDKTSNIINIVGNVVTAVSAGSAQVVLTCGSIVKVINVNVTYVPTQICAYLNDMEIENGQELTIEPNKSYYLSCYVYSGDQLLSNFVSCYENNVLINNFENELRLNYSEEGSCNFKFVFDSFKLEITINIKLLNPVTKLEFDSDKITINMFETSSYNLIYNLETTYSNLPTTDKITFVSSNENIVKISNQTIVPVGIGNANVYALINDVKVTELSVEVINKEVYCINSLSDFINMDSDKNYVVMSNLDFSTFTANDCISFGGEIDFNNKTISNLNTRLFNTINEGGLVKNLVVSGGVTIDANNITSVASLDPCFSLISEVNYGTISNISFSNFTLTLTNNLSVSNVNLTLVSSYNYGLISNVLLSSTSITVNFVSTKVAGVVVSGISYVNHGEISEVVGSIVFTGFTRASGLVIENYNTIKNINLSLTFNCTQIKHQIGGLVYKTAVNDVVPVISNISTTISVNNVSEGTITFAGFVYNAASGLSPSNISLNINFSGEFSSSTTYLVYYNKPSSVDVVSKFNIITNQTFSNYPN